MNYHILDTETASLQGGICEIAWLEVDQDLNILSEFQTLVDPEREIDPGAQAIHGITADMVRGKPTLATVAAIFDEPILICGHNIGFDIRMIKEAIQVKERVCTLKLAREFIQNTTNHKLETLQKELNLPIQQSHSALGDVHTVRDLLLYLREHHGVSLSREFERAAIPKLVHKMPFGKHRGRVLTSIAADYRDWLLTQEIDKDLRFSLERLKGI